MKELGSPYLINESDINNEDEIYYCMKYLDVLIFNEYEWF